MCPFGHFACPVNEHGTGRLLYLHFFVWAHGTQGYWSLAAGALPSANTSLPSFLISCLIWSALLATRPHWPVVLTPCDGSHSAVPSTLLREPSKPHLRDTIPFVLMWNCTSLARGSALKGELVDNGSTWRGLVVYFPDNTIMLSTRTGWFWNCIFIGDIGGNHGGMLLPRQREGKWLRGDICTEAGRW